MQHWLAAPQAGRLAGLGFWLALDEQLMRILAAKNIIFAPRLYLADD